MNAGSSTATKNSSPAGQGATRLNSAATKPLNSCHRCGATAYKTLIARDETGAMRASGQYQCVQCKLVFRDVKAWREGADREALASSESESQDGKVHRWIS